jgi:serine phosphatase RsbU (regulator of sigma subunit)
LSGFVQNDTFKYSQYNLQLFNNTIVVGTDNGIYFIEDNQLIPLYKKYNSKYFNKKNLYIHRIYNENNKRLWVVMFHNSSEANEKLEIGYITFKNKEINFTSRPFKSIQEAIHTIATDKNGNVWFGGVKQLFVYNPDVDISSFDTSQCYISNINLKGDSTISSFLHYTNGINTNISYNLNSITFKFTSPSYVGGSNNEFSTYLVGIDNDWSNWSKSNTKTYERLENGDYIFKVKSKNFYNQESKIAYFKFTILPPWYKTWWAFTIYFLITILLIYIIIKISLKRVQEQNTKLEKIVEERTAEVEQQKREIELKNKDIVDSIIYAKRIQNTILPPKERLDEILKDYFVIYKPKDIVSGDFYWADLLDGKSYFSVIDCTGHGVPGAFVSIVGFNGLKRTVNEFKVREPGKILDKLTDIVIDTFTASESQLKDGMDLSLCSLDYKTLTLEYAGANNSLIILRNSEIIEIKANKQPIGEFDNRIPFSNHKIQLQKGDCIFLFSDGYADQFGGPKGKKFKLKTLKNLFAKIAHLTPKQQKEKLENAFDEWKGEFEQLDDVCIIGVKI